MTGVKLKSGGQIVAGMVVCAAGWHSYKIAAMAGCGAAGAAAQAAGVRCGLPASRARRGMTIDPSGVVFRPEGRFFITAISPKDGEPDPDAEDFDFDHEVFDREIWPQLAARVPAFETLKVQNAWCCHYDVSTLDHNAILGPHPDAPGRCWHAGSRAMGCSIRRGWGAASPSSSCTEDTAAIDLSASATGACGGASRSSS